MRINMKDWDWKDYVLCISIITIEIVIIIYSFEQKNDIQKE